MTDNDYEAGLRDGRLDALEKIVDECKSDNKTMHMAHEARFKSHDKIIWMIIGALGLIQFLPELTTWLGSVK